MPGSKEREVVLDTECVGDSRLTLNDLGIILNDVNKIRLALGIGEGKLPELPKGIRQSESQCVLARALSNGWEVRVDDQITLSHPSQLTNFDWEKAASTLENLGFDCHFVDDSYYDDFYEETVEDKWIVIETTDQMKILIEDFDKGLLPDLVLND